MSFFYVHSLRKAFNPCLPSSLAQRFKHNKHNFTPVIRAKLLGVTRNLLILLFGITGKKCLPSSESICTCVDTSSPNVFLPLSYVRKSGASPSDSTGKHILIARYKWRSSPFFPSVTHRFDFQFPTYCSCMHKRHKFLANVSGVFPNGTTPIRRRRTKKKKKEPKEENKKAACLTCLQTLFSRRTHASSAQSDERMKKHVKIWDNNKIKTCTTDALMPCVRVNIKRRNGSLC